jgi:N-acyl-L-homoserine lactone synthetase
MSSASNKFISNEEAVPVIDGELFKGHEDSRFALAVLGPDDVLSYKPGSLAEAYLKLRANVYVDQTGMLEHGVKRQDGTELDADDERSTHFVVCENRMGSAAVVACMRLIEKTDSRDILPIEDFFPDAFEVPAPTKSIEVSRFIVREDEAKLARRAKIELITAGLAHAVGHQLGPIYGVAEPMFERDLRLMRMPIKRIAEPKLVPEYNDNNLGFEIDKVSLVQRIGEVAVRKMTVPEGSIAYWGEMVEDEEEQRQANG